MSHGASTGSTDKRISILRLPLYEFENHIPKFIG